MSAAANAAGYLYRQGVIGPASRVQPGAGRVVEPPSRPTVPAARTLQKRTP